MFQIGTGGINMNIKFNQTIDNIHGTIYYTDLEKNIINTPFFSRLHDVNQSSTVYLTFPPNRTKRYEHSLGVMQISSDLFSSAVINSYHSYEFQHLINNADKAFDAVIKYIRHMKRNYPFEISEDIGRVYQHVGHLELVKIKNSISKNFFEFFAGNCLLNFVPAGLEDGYKAFLLVALQESVRLVGLLHDVGHPPQSHIVESVLSDKYDEILKIPKDQRTERQNAFLSCISKYKSCDHNIIEDIDQQMAIKTKNIGYEALHEMAGIYIVKHIFNTTFPGLISNAFKKEAGGKTSREDCMVITVSFYASLIEFVFAILRDKNQFWKGLHSIVAGMFDADRFDFVQRDSHNSGMNWGRISCRRIFNTVKFVLTKTESAKLVVASSLSGIGENIEDFGLHIAFSSKNVPLLDDLLYDRYKIFTLINYHHRSAKIAKLYQESIRILMDKYLSSNDNGNNDIGSFKDISGLWKALDIPLTNEGITMSLFQWNDSWLNGLLYKILVTHHTQVYLEDDTSIDQCCSNLEEIFLARKKHISLIKRKSELLDIQNSVIDNLADLLSKMETFLSGTYKDVLSTGNYASKEYDMCIFLDSLLSAIKCMDWKTIELHLGIEIIENSIKSALDTIDDIESYFISKVSFSDGIEDGFIYDASGTPHNYLEYSDIDKRLNLAKLSFPLYYVYVQPRNQLKEEMLQSIRISIGGQIAQSIESAVEALIDID